MSTEWVVAPSRANDAMIDAGKYRDHHHGDTAYVYAQMLRARPTGPDVPKLLVQKTEAEWLDAFNKWHATQFNLNGHTCPHEDYECNGWFAALRLVGAIKEDGK